MVQVFHCSLCDPMLNNPFTLFFFVPEASSRIGDYTVLRKKVFGQPPAELPQLGADTSFRMTIKPMSSTEEALDRMVDPK